MRHIILILILHTSVKSNSAVSHTSQLLEIKTYGYDIPHFWDYLTLHNLEHIIALLERTVQCHKQTRNQSEVK